MIYTRAFLLWGGVDNLPSTITCWKIASLHPHLIPTMEIPTIVAHDTCTTKHVPNPYVMIIIYQLVFLYDTINLFHINFFYEKSKPFVKQSYATKLLLVFRNQCVIKYTVHSIHCAGEHTCIDTKNDTYVTCKNQVSITKKYNQVPPAKK